MRVWLVSYDYDWDDGYGIVGIAASVEAGRRIAEADETYREYQMPPWAPLRLGGVTDGGEIVPDWLTASAGRGGPHFSIVPYDVQE